MQLQAATGNCMIIYVENYYWNYHSVDALKTDPEQTKKWTAAFSQHYGSRCFFYVSFNFVFSLAFFSFRCSC